jgi:hypothetical protein
MKTLWVIALSFVFLIISSSSVFSQTTDSNYGIKAFRNSSLDDAIVVIGSQNDSDTVNSVFGIPSSYSKSDVNPNILIGGSVANELVGDINAELGVDFEVLDSEKTGVHPTRIVLKSSDDRFPYLDPKQYKVYSGDFGKKSYFAILSSGKDIAIEGTDRYGTKAGAIALIGEDLPYDKIIGLWNDLDDNGEVEEGEIELLEKYKSSKSSAGEVVIDGIASPGEWKDEWLLASDAKGDDSSIEGADLKAIYAVRKGDTIYWRIDEWDNKMKDYSNIAISFEGKRYLINIGLPNIVKSMTSDGTFEEILSSTWTLKPYGGGTVYNRGYEFDKKDCIDACYLFNSITHREVIELKITDKSFSKAGINDISKIKLYMVWFWANNPLREGDAIKTEEGIEIPSEG